MAGERPPPAMRVLLCFGFLKKGWGCSQSGLIGPNHLLFTSDPLLGCPPSCAELVNKSKATTHKKPAWSVEINGQNYSFWQSSSHITLRPHSYHYWRFHLSGRETETCVCCTVCKEFGNYINLQLCRRNHR